MATGFSKFVRPPEARRGIITERDLDIIEAVLRYRFSPTSELIRLVGGNEDVTHRRLRKLWEWGLINRFAFPDIRRRHSEFHYYLDSRTALDILATQRRLEPHSSMLEEIDNNREKDYADATLTGKYMQLGFLKHQLQVSRMHFMLEMAARRSDGQVTLAAWHQGALLRAKVSAPKTRSRRVEATNEHIWEESDETERLPVEPDALFSLQFSSPEGGTPVSHMSHFCYEADRGTMTPADMLRKFRAYYHFIKRRQGHKEAFGVHPIRAVLIEAPDEPRARKLMDLAQTSMVSGAGKRAGLFWFTIAPLFTERRITIGAPTYLARPEILLDRVWALPDRTMHALTDTENCASATNR